MKIQTLRMLTVSLAVCLTPAAVADVTVNGVVFTSFKMSANAAGDITLTTVPEAAPDTIPASLPKAVFDITMTSLPGGATSIDTIPGPGAEGGFTPVNCVADPTNAACPVEPPPPPPGTCDKVVPFFETIAWASQPRKQTVVTGRAGTASKFSTTTSKTYQGKFQAVPDSASGHLVRRMWFSECPGGTAIVQTYSYRGSLINKCEIKGSEPVIFWTQQDTPTYIQSCKLNRGTTYYLNYSQSAMGTGSGPTSTSRLFRSSYVGGTP